MATQIETWEETGSRSTTRADDPRGFINQHVAPLLIQHTEDITDATAHAEILSEEQFWGKQERLLFGTVRLSAFRLTDWFPRAPGVYWSMHAKRAREVVWSGPSTHDPKLGRYFSPQSKMGLVEQGGIGTIRLLPRRIDGVTCWLATALTKTMCNGGIPVAIPDTLVQKVGMRWGDVCNLEGRVRFLQDLGLEEPASRVHHARPLIVFVEQLEPVISRRSIEPIVISPVVLFTGVDGSFTRGGFYPRPRYAFVYCGAGPDDELDAAVDWIEIYASNHAGQIITNFDEQRPVLADAPLSYQRLVAKNYDRDLVDRFAGSITVQRIDQFVQQSVINQYFGAIHMGHNINVGGDAIINIDAVLTNVTQTIGSTTALEPAQKTKLDGLVESLKADLTKLKQSHAEETRAIVESLDRAVAHATKPPQERKEGLLKLSANGLKEAAALVASVAPNVLKTATLIANFITGLVGG